MPQSFGRSIRRGNNQAAIIFVHGLFGSPVTTWGAFPDLISSDPDLEHCDVLCWGYPTSPWGALPSIPYLGRRVPPIPDVALALRAALCAGEAAAYSDLLLVGHSMGGLVIQKMIVDDLTRADGTSTLLQRIRGVMFYATPSSGVQARSILLLHRQARDLRRTSQFLEALQPEWLQRVYNTRPSDAPQAGRRFIPVKPVVGLEDNAVPLSSAGDTYSNVASVPGNHTEMCKPTTHKDLAYQILRTQILMHTCPEWVASSAKLIAVNCRIVDNAREHLFAIGSRSRDATYLSRIEEMLKQRPEVVYWRVLFGPPRRQALKDHLLRVATLRSSTDRSTGHRNIFIGMFTDTAQQQEYNLVGNERACCVVMPSMTGLGDYSTGYIATDRARVDAFFSFAQQMYQASEPLDTIEQIQELPVISK